MTQIVPVILCGGSGTRLWPLSRENYPKQFVDLGSGRTLFGDTIDRVLHLSERADPIVVCNEKHRFYASAELFKNNVRAKIILEPEGRNTAPGLALAALSAISDNPQALLLVLPADHSIENIDDFVRGVQQAIPSAESDNIVTFGIKPTRPETGFGYIQQGEPLDKGTFRVARFVEKPASDVAQEMLNQGGFFWNSGMFLMQAQVYLDELHSYASKIYGTCVSSWERRVTDKAFVRPDKDLFLSCPSDSIDYAVMEHTNRAAVVPLDTSWSDLGSWEAFYQTGMPDDQGNVLEGDVLTENVENCYCHTQNRLVAAIGLRDICIVETRDAVLVAPRAQSQDVKKIVQRLHDAERPEYREHPLVYRPWGSYETLALGARFQVKRIIVDPGAELSLQMHHHRAEHWVVVSGTAEVTNGEAVQLLSENQSTYIPVGTRHRLRNPGVIPLILIEIQSGSYLGEDDIVRFEDDYGRN